MINYFSILVIFICSIVLQIMATNSEKDYGMKKNMNQETKFNHWMVLIEEKIMVYEPGWKFLSIVLSWFVFTMETVNIFCYSVLQLCHIVHLPFTIQCRLTHFG